MKANNNLQSFYCHFKLWNNNDNLVWLASTIHLFRNIEKFKFPVKLDIDRRKQIVSLLGKEFLSIDQVQQSGLFKAEDLSALDKEYLVEHFLSSQSFHSASTGEAFIVDMPGEMMVMLNLRNHIHFEYIDTHNELENAWNHVVKLETAL